MLFSLQESINVCRLNLCEILKVISEVNRFSLMHAIPVMKMKVGKLKFCDNGKVAEYAIKIQSRISEFKT